MASVAGAADLEVPVGAPPQALAHTGFETRFGAFYHGMGNPEKNTVDLSGELVIAKPDFGTAYWTYMIPRPHVGGSLNLSHKTSFAYAGALWTFPVYQSWFFETYLDAAFHNGVLDGDPTRSAMGCDPLFHVGASLGYQVSQH